jgi:cyclopropane fatty-acyl-phospholipid synthase-like methyltransferase
LSVSPEVTKVTGIDIDEEAVQWAEREFKTDKIEFIKADFTTHTGLYDTLVCLETIEHLKNLNELIDLVKRCSFEQLIISFPDKKSTHFNKFHFHDFVIQDIVDLFPAYLNYHRFRSGDVQFLLFIKLPANFPSHICRNISDIAK